MPEAFAPSLPQNRHHLAHRGDSTSIIDNFSVSHPSLTTFAGGFSFQPDSVVAVGPITAWRVSKPR